jgi:outer membrane protein assembly factor BamB
MKQLLAGIVIPGVLAILGVAVLVFWVEMAPVNRLEARLPGLDGAPPPRTAKVHTRPVVGEPVLSGGAASKIGGQWPWFRGPNGDAMSHDDVRLARRWPQEGPKRLWSIELGEGYAAAAVSQGRVFVLDHMHDGAADLLRGLPPNDRKTLADALSKVSPGDFDGNAADNVLHPLFKQAGPADNAAESPGASLSSADYDGLKTALRTLLTDHRDELLRALRNDSLDDVDRSADTLRCLSLDDGKEIWHNSYPVVIPSHHGISRTIPAVIGNYVISFGPKCQVVCWDAETGKARWLLDLVLDYAAEVPPWYAGQCPLIDTVNDRLILAPGGKALLIAVDYKTGKVLWESPNPRHWAMTHVSVVPMEFAGRRMYVYCGKGGVAGVSADNGAILWDTTDWQIGTATCPTPVVVEDGKIFFCGGYNAGSLMLQLKEEGGQIAAKTLFRLTAKQFGSEQQTPVFCENHLYGVRQKDQQLVCLDLDGKELWNSGRDKFGSAPYMIADGLIFALNDDGRLTMAEATSAGYKPLARAQVIENGVTSWGPMALVAGRLIVRDLTRMVSVDVRD